MKYANPFTGWHELTQGGIYPPPKAVLPKSVVFQPNIEHLPSHEGMAKTNTPSGYLNLFGH